jgi:hypothetical protein
MGSVEKLTRKIDTSSSVLAGRQLVEKDSAVEGMLDSTQLMTCCSSEQHWHFCLGRKCLSVEWQLLARWGIFRHGRKHNLHCL